MIVLLAIIVLIILVVLTRTLLFKPEKTVNKHIKTVEFNKERAVENLCELVKCKTISYYDSSLENDAEFKKLIGLLPTLYPNVAATCEFKELPDRALLFKWKGQNSDAAAVMMAHYDVVPVNEELWEKPPFEAIIEDGVIWGRGTLDTKVTMNAILSAAEHLIEKGFVPKQDIYFAFSGGEETNGKGAINIVDYFIENNIKLSFVVDEGGAVVENVFPGVKAPCGLIGIAEKGLMNVKYTAKSGGGHASAPKPNTPFERLSRACLNISHYPTKSHLTIPVAEMFDTLGRHSSFIYRMIFANLWLFYPVLDSICTKSGGELNALMRTTVAFTQSNGSTAPNVIPPEATLVSNIRINPFDTTDSVLEYLKKTVDDKDIEITMLEGTNPSRISKTECSEWEKVASAVADTWQGSIVSPYLMVQCSDSRHYGRISDKVYRFSAMDLTSEERATIHGNNERIRIDALCRSVEFYIRLLEKC